MVDLTENKKSLIGYMTKSEKHVAYGFELILKSGAPEEFFVGLRNAGFFDIKNNPKPKPVEGKGGYFRIPFWPALGYLTSISKIAGKRNDEQLGIALMEIVREISAIDSEHEQVDNYHTSASFAEIISNVPTSCVRLNDLDLVKNWLLSRWSNESVISELDSGAMLRFLNSDSNEDHLKAIRLLEYVTELKASDESERPLRTSVTIADPYWLEKLLEHHSASLGEKIGGPAIDCLLSRLRQLFEEDYIAEHTWLHRAAIETHEQNQDWDHVTNAFVDSARDALDAWQRVDSLSAKAYAIDMLQDEAQIVRRIAINFMRVHWDIFQNEIETLISPALFDEGHVHELYLLLQEKYQYFSTKAKEDVLTIIEKLSDVVEVEGDELKFALYQQRTWLDAIHGFGNQQADIKYQQLVEVMGPVGEHPDFLSYHSTWWGTGPTPYTQEEIISFATDKTLIQRIDGYVIPKDERLTSRKSLIDVLSNAVLASPDKFVWALSASISMSRRVQYGLINGFGKFIDQEKDSKTSSAIRSILNILLPYLNNLVSDMSFWTEAVEETSDFEPTKNWIPSLVAEIAKKVASSDSIKLSDSDFQNILGMVQAVKKNSKGLENAEDPMTAAINNTRGRAVEALLQLILRQCRDADKSGGGHRLVWLEMQPFINDEISGCVEGENLESSTLFGCYLPQLQYIDDEWVTTNIERIFPVAHTKNLLCAVGGLSYANFTTRVYKILKHADVPRLALKNEFLRGSPRERLIERIALAYIWGEEALDGPCIEEMFSTNRIDDLIELASTVSRWANEKLKAEQVARAKALASKCIYFGLEDVASRKMLLAIASRFISFVLKPADEDMHWLLAVTPFSHNSRGESYFLKALDAMASADALKALSVFEIFLLDYEFSYDFRDHLPSIVRKLNASGLHLEAIKIVNQLVRKGGGAKWVDLYNELLVGAKENTPPDDV